MTDEVDGRRRLFQDSLLDRLVGRWNATVKIAGQLIQHPCEAGWMLNHQFLDIPFKVIRGKTADSESNHAPYEAFSFIGFDNMTERYVVHWLDIFGGRYSETLGFGERKDGNSIKFAFESPTGPLHNTFSRRAEEGAWSMVIEQKDAKGKWSLLADEVLRKLE